MLSYNVSEKTIRNWIAASKAGKLDLKLYEEKGKTYITDSTANNYLLEKITLNGRKYRNNRNHKTITPTPEFYKLFDEKQVIDIANTLVNYREIAWHYSYFGEAATYWNQYLHELYEAGKPNLITNTLEALDSSLPYVHTLIKPYKHVNVFNLCIGNNLAIRNVLDNLIKQQRVERFGAVDISPTVLDIADHNIQQWFGGSVVMEKHLLDLNKHTFDHILNSNSFGDDAGETINLIFLIAGPLHNFHEPDYALRTIRKSMNKNDLLFVTVKRDTEVSNSFFDFNIKADPSALGFRRRMLLELLNIDESLYTPEQLFVREDNRAYIRIKLSFGLTINFQTDSYMRTVEFNKGDTILLWRGWRFSDQALTNLYDQAGFSVLYNAHSLDRELSLQIVTPNLITSPPR